VSSVKKSGADAGFQALALPLILKEAAKLSSDSSADSRLTGTAKVRIEPDWIRDYVNDMACAHTMALAYLRNGDSFQVLNCGYGHGYWGFDVISSVRRETAVGFSVRMGQQRAGYVAALVADSSRIRRVFNWRPKFGEFNTILGGALRWERQLAKICGQRAGR